MLMSGISFYFCVDQSVGLLAYGTDGTGVWSGGVGGRRKAEALPAEALAKAGQQSEKRQEGWIHLARLLFRS
jgi:hypothetical protein